MSIALQALAERLLSNALLPIAAVQRASTEASTSDGDGRVLHWSTLEESGQLGSVEDALLAVLSLIAGLLTKSLCFS